MIADSKSSAEAIAGCEGESEVSNRLHVPSSGPQIYMASTQFGASDAVNTKKMADEAFKATRCGEMMFVLITLLVVIFTSPCMAVLRKR